MQRIIRITLSLFISVALLSTPAMANPKYAGLVMDADTGEVLYQDNADARRYPASLTKMMTLYLLFDALRQGDVSMRTRMPVSAKAAAQQPSKLYLKQGESISVEDAIKALVVKSANDVSIVVAEYLGGSEWKFALDMTNKARELGMRHTVFRNPHGLPDRKQYTTARDMAKLGIALRRDFPQYYHFFKYDRFTWNGKTITGHNRVLKRYDGVDGIKTGYINASGFNLVTSVRKDGYNLVAVVMGGKTSRSRDDHMVDLIDRSYTRLAQRGDRPRAFASAAPKPILRPSGVAANVAAAAAPVKVASVSRAVVPASAVEAVVQEKPKQFIRFISDPEPQKAEPSAPKPAPKKAMKAPPGTLEFQLASLQSSRSAKDIVEGWGIQVGAFRSEQDALKAAAKAVELARDALQDSKVAITDSGSSNRSVHRARLANLSEYEAKSACKKLQAHKEACFVFRLDGERSL